MGTTEAYCWFCDPDVIVRYLVGVFDTCYARWDAYPATPGHVLIIPRRHVASVFELTAQETADMASLLCQAPTWTRDYNPDGYTIGINEGTAAGRSIPHVHQHVIPRHDDDMPNPRGGVRLATPNANFGLWLEERT
jgi:diadenosine tetraphosphate (Ap4A) HIT family hydrolase